ncbi:hypothetical protein [Streptomyces sp. B3I8]|uniref:hypothetical protein n=1 Tax=Streptomyces sp. B3I8 TaxID=3042303 RepID=UPI002785D48A|nr:hypothetical protein [Streptomyces sp. B3I8]MDQ0791321.1 hypothetical protein [Streptomyces sp. B3I8]
MRRLTLYTRSRQVPASLAVLLVSALVLWTFTRDAEGDPRLPVLVLATGAMATSAGLGGHDLALDRTAAIRWAPRRAAHVLIAAAAVCAALPVVESLGGAPAPLAFAVRDAAGLMGLAALGAALWGRQYAWTLPFTWLAFTLFAPPATGTPTRIATWLLLPPGTASATWTAVTLTALGTATYALAGPRR